MGVTEPLSPREEEVLAAVGRRLTNGEIAAELYVSVRTVESHIAALRRKLGAESRTALVEAAGRRRTTGVPRPHNSFVGRDAELATVSDLIDRSRCVTLVGSAGAGKTRLALELAATRSDLVPVVVELADAIGVDVARKVARAIGVGADADAGLLDAAAVVLTGREWLVVLDNCDRVAAEARESVDRLLHLVGTVRVLATSRVPLGGTDEAVYTLLPLPVEGSSSAAVQLFRERAAASAPRVQLTDDDEDQVVDLCERLDGLPLAIELAAARLRLLPIGELSQRLTSGFGALEGTGREDRHHTLEAAFSWSWDLLEPGDQAVLSQLAALPRGFDLDLARAVVGPGADDSTMRLLERSLVTEAPSRDGPPRFRLLESLRAFVLDRTDPAVVADVRERHADVFVEIATSLASKARLDDSPSAKAAAEHACSDINAALIWALDNERQDVAVALTHALAIGVEQYGPDIDSIHALTRAARQPWLQVRASVPDLMNLGIALSLGDLGLVRDLAEVALARADDDESRAAAQCLTSYALAYADRGEEALIHVDLAETSARAIEDSWLLASALQARGTALCTPSVGRPEDALEAFEAAMQTYALAGDAMHVNNCRYLMAATAAEAGIRTEQALVWAEQCVTYTTASEDEHERAHAILTRNALVDDPSVDELQTVADDFRSVGDLHCLTRSLLRLADLLSGAEQIGALRQAALVAQATSHSARQSEALDRLVHVSWEAGDHHAAAAALGELSVVVGDEEALARCPAALRNDVTEWVAAIAEGRARALSSELHDLNPTR